MLPKKRPFQVANDYKPLLLNFLRDRRFGSGINDEVIKEYRSRSIQFLDLHQIASINNDTLFDITSIDLERQDGKLLLAGSNFAQLQIINCAKQFAIYDSKSIKSVECDAEIAGAHQSAITCVSWYPADNGLFLSSSFDGKVKLWDTDTAKCASTFNLGDSVLYAAFGQTIGSNLVAATVKSAGIRLCDLRSGHSIHTLANAGITCVQWSPKYSNVLYSCGTDMTVREWDIRRPNGCLAIFDINNTQNNANNANSASRRKIRSYSAAFNGISITPDGNTLLSVAVDGSMMQWDLWTRANSLVNFGRLKIKSAMARVPQFAGSYQFGNKKMVRAAGTLDWISPSPPIAFLPHEAEVRGLQLDTGKRIVKLTASFNAINDTSVHPFEDIIYTGGAKGEIGCFVSKYPQVGDAFVDDNSSDFNDLRFMHEDEQLV